VNRSRFQGVVTILRFNWHFFAGAALGLALLLALAVALPGPLGSAALALFLVGVLAVFLSLAASFVAYDAGGLYRLDWLDPWMQSVERAANLHAGFDETSVLLRARYPQVDWTVFDFYDPAKHTEISIRRARVARPPHPGTLALSTTSPSFGGRAYGRHLLILSAHEIRAHSERVSFFRALRLSLDADGAIIVVEHLRDPANCLVYTIGAWHFHTPSEWLATFAEAGLRVQARQRLNPFITLFVLRPA
jgi:hypothetical protein